MAEVERITQATVERTAPIPGRDVWVRERKLRGFALRVYPSGRRAFVLVLHRGGRGHVVIGEPGAPWKPDPATGAARVLTVDLARDEAIRLMGSQLDGKDPRTARDTSPTVPTLTAFSARYLEEWAEIEKAPRSVAEDRGLLKRHILPWGGTRRLDRLGPGDLTKLKAALRDKPVTFNRCRSLVSHMYGRAHAWGELPRSHPNPALEVPPYEERGRERALSPEELAAVGPALLLEEKEAPVAAAALRAIMLTGARPVELLPLLRTELKAALKAGVLVRPSLKVGRRRRRERPVYLNPFASTVLEEAPTVPGNPHVFPATGSNGRKETRGKALSISALEASWDRVCKYVAGWKRERRRWKAPEKPSGIDLSDVHVYDLRHTFGTIAGLLIEHPKHVQDLLGHSDFRTTQRYIHLSTDPLRAASERVGASISEAMKPKMGKAGD